MSRISALSTWDLAEKVLPVAPRILLYGPPGCGKTHVATHLGLRTARQKVQSVTLTEETPASDLRGMFVPKGGDFIWHDGPGVRAWRSGDRLIINEVDHASPDVWSFLLSLLDDPEVAFETLPNGDTVRPKAGYHVVATMNGVPEDLTEALRDRFTIALNIAEPNPAAIQALSEDLRDAAKGTVTLRGARHIGMRSWFAFDHLRDSLGAEVAAQAVFGERASSVLTSLKAGGA